MISSEVTSYGAMDGAVESAEQPDDRPSLLSPDRETVYMQEPAQDGRMRRIDYILAWEVSEEAEEETKRQQYRKTFEKRLRMRGLTMEREEDGDYKFIKVHATYPCLFKLADEMKIKLPLRWNDLQGESSLLTTVKHYMKWASDMFVPPVFPEDDDENEELAPLNPYNYFTAEFSLSRKDKFAIDVLGLDNFFTVAERSRLVQHILDETVFQDEKQESNEDGNIVESQQKLIGIGRMLKMGNYKAAYPLHDGPYRLRDDDEHERWVEHKPELNDRQKIYYTWASPRAWYKLQPMDPIRRYFGEKIAIYFSWLGYYTQMLAFAAVVGVLVFMYGLITMGDAAPTQGACPGGDSSLMIMCPLCYKPCKYWMLADACSSVRLNHLFDNNLTVFFAVFLALWGTLFLEFWKRTQNVQTYEWDLFGFEDEQETLRQEYEENAKRHKDKWFKLNPITQLQEPFTPFVTKVTKMLASISIVLTMIVVVIGAVIGVVLYRIIIYNVGSHSSSGVIRTESSSIASGTGSVINLIFIMVFSAIYGKIAYWLTNFECPRTDTEFEDSYTVKMFVFQFVNYYSSIMYIAFYKGKNVGYPGNYNTIAGARQEECDPGGCLIELTEQLAIIMIGKQFINNVQEILVPLLSEWWMHKKLLKEAMAEQNLDVRRASSMSKLFLQRWEQDYSLTPQPELNLFGEYLEMVIQFGFATLFACAFPLAPFFAFINNVIEVRLDAFKFVGVLQRPWAQKAQDIGSWYEILDYISIMAVLFNAFIIAFTSSYIDQLVWSGTDPTSTYWDFVYAEANATATFPGYLCESSIMTAYNYTVESDCVPKACAYLGYRNDYDDRDGIPYALNQSYYHVLAARLIFVIVFEHFVFFVKAFLAYIVPDMPGDVKVQQLREQHVTRTVLFGKTEEEVDVEDQTHQGDDFAAMDGSMRVYEPQ
jgi:hypothetical protein